MIRKWNLMWMVLWSGTLEREGKAPGLSNFQGRSQLASAIEQADGFSRLKRVYLPSRPLTPLEEERARLLHKHRRLGQRTIARVLRTTIYRVQMALGEDDGTAD